jgi:hypothetical protein
MSRGDLPKDYRFRRMLRPRDVAMSGTWRPVKVLKVATPTVISELFFRQ